MKDICEENMDFCLKNACSVFQKKNKILSSYVFPNTILLCSQVCSEFDGDPRVLG